MIRWGKKEVHPKTQSRATGLQGDLKGMKSDFSHVMLLHRLRHPPKRGLICLCNSEGEAIFPSTSRSAPEGKVAWRWKWGFFPRPDHLVTDQPVRYDWFRCTHKKGDQGPGGGNICRVEEHKHLTKYNTRERQAMEMGRIQDGRRAKAFGVKSMR